MQSSKYTYCLTVFDAVRQTWFVFGERFGSGLSLQGQLGANRWCCAVCSHDSMCYVKAGDEGWGGQLKDINIFQFSQCIICPSLGQVSSKGLLISSVHSGYLTTLYTNMLFYSVAANNKQEDRSGFKCIWEFFSVTALVWFVVSANNNLLHIVFFSNFPKWQNCYIHVLWVIVYLENKKKNKRQIMRFFF